MMKHRWSRMSVILGMVCFALTASAVPLRIASKGEAASRIVIDADVNAIIAAQGAKIPKDRVEDVRRQIANQCVQGFFLKNSSTVFGASGDLEFEIALRNSLSRALRSASVTT